MNKPNPSEHLMERCIERENMLRAWKRVKKNGGSAGIDAMSIEDAVGYLKTEWPQIRLKLLVGSYQPKAVRRVEIPKPDGGMRQLGIPTVVDRLIQQCILQILQPDWDPTFHKHSYGFRPMKSAHQAVAQAQAFVESGRKWCVDVDLEKFFDRVSHDILMDRVNKRVKDKRLVKLIHRYLKAGIMDQGVVMVQDEGTPQGGPLSPLLSNLLLDEVDQELEKRGLAFVRYADDCNVYVRSKRAAQKAMLTMEHITGKLKLKINREKSAVAYFTKRKFLGYRLWISTKSIVKQSVAPQAIAKLKSRIRELTSRTCGRNIEQVVETLNGYLVGWKNYFKLANTPRIFEELDGWIRRRLRMIYLKQWKRVSTCRRELVARGLSLKAAESISRLRRCYWRMSGSSGMKIALPNSVFDAMGLKRLNV